MVDKVLLLVRLPATQRTFELRVSADLTVRQAAGMIARLVATRERERYLAGDDVGLMPLEGEHAGELLDADARVRDFVHEGVIRDGALLALV